ncbi:MAG: glycosyltransferase, partial [Planctomycetota bacterium]
RPRSRALAPALRLLYLTHLYPPHHTAGVEVFASTTAELLAARGHELRVITTQKDIARPDLSTREVGGGGAVSVLEIANNLFATRFEETYRRPEIDAIIAAELDRYRPDLVHVHHLLYLSSGALEVCRERGVPVVMTLHDFWLGCARFGQLLHANGSRCVTVDPERCGTCLPSLEWRQSSGARTIAKAVSAVASVTGIDLKGPLVTARRFKDTLKDREGASAARAESGSSEPDWIPPSLETAATYEALARARIVALVEVVHRCVDRLVLPAAFMRDWFEAFGLDASRMVVETTGVDWEGARSVPRVERGEGEPLRFLFLGSLVPHKGGHILLEAWSQLDDRVRSGAVLRLFGPDQHRPAYVSALRARAEGLGVELGGALGREDVRRAMAETDVLVVPSLWLEIRPLVMLEAYAAGARVIASDLGGMREAIDDGLPGRVVPEGNARALAAAIADEVELHAAGQVDGAQERRPTALFRSWNDVATGLERLYADVLG